MSEQKRMAVLESIMAVAWADGEYETRERSLIDGVVRALEPGQAAGEPAEPVRLSNLHEILETDSEREYCYQQAAKISFADGTVRASERQVLDALAAALGITAEQAAELEESALELLVDDD